MDGKLWRVDWLTIITDIVPIVMAGIIGIYGLVVSVLIANDLTQKVSLYAGFIQLGAGLAVGLAGMAAGYVNDRNSAKFQCYLS